MRKTCVGLEQRCYSLDGSCVSQDVSGKDAESVCDSTGGALATNHEALIAFSRQQVWKHLNLNQQKRARSRGISPVIVDCR